MSIRKYLLTSALLASLAPVMAVADIIVQTAPPPIQVEPVPTTIREGYIWTPGYQKWENDRFVWVPGRMIEAKPDSRWVPDTWVEVADGRWRFEPGHWEVN